LNRFLALDFVFILGIISLIYLNLTYLLFYKPFQGSKP
jgi:hypothetical protein